MADELFGRKNEIEILEEALSSNRAEMVSVIGRRRVGKTFLIRETYQNHIAFEATGIQHATRREQLRNFVIQLNEFSDNSFPMAAPKDWLDAFYLLTKLLDKKLASEKIVVFLDELPWLATQRSGFLKGLSWFWNSWAVNKNIVVVICGSAASWMIQKVVNHRGGLHNRITKRIHLQAFTLSETKQYLTNNGIRFDPYQLIQIYMAMGGIPHYLKEIKRGDSAAQNINRICFSPTGLLSDEFSRLYVSLFKNGLTREEIIKVGKLPSGGLVSRVLEELLASGFIAAYRPFGKKKKEKLYRLTDEYSLFYLNFIEGKEHEGDDIWNLLSQTQTYKTWSGYAFENICLKHIAQIKKALGISGIYSLSGSFYKKGTTTEKGTQIDLLIDRNDHVINLFEVKFYNEPYTITKDYAAKLREKMSIFRTTTKTKKQLFWVFISTFGMLENQHSGSIIAKSLTMDDLFED